MLEEVAMYDDMGDGIEILSDARHGWRKHAKDTSVVAIGEQTDKVLRHEHISRIGCTSRG